jgi:hypothetical protein
MSSRQPLAFHHVDNVAVIRGPVCAARVDGHCAQRLFGYVRKWRQIHARLISVFACNSGSIKTEGRIALADENLALMQI